MTEDEMRSVTLPADTVAAVEERVERSEFGDVSEYISHVLDEVLFHVQRREVTDETTDDEELQDRLRSLGYME